MDATRPRDPALEAWHGRRRQRQPSPQPYQTYLFEQSHLTLRGSHAARIARMQAEGVHKRTTYQRRAKEPTPLPPFTRTPPAAFRARAAAAQAHSGSSAGASRAPARSLAQSTWYASGPLEQQHLASVDVRRVNVRRRVSAPSSRADRTGAGASDHGAGARPLNRAGRIHPGHKHHVPPEQLPAPKGAPRRAAFPAAAAPSAAPSSAPSARAHSARGPSALGPTARALSARAPAAASGTELAAEPQLVLATPVATPIVWAIPPPPGLSRMARPSSPDMAPKAGLVGSIGPARPNGSKVFRPDLALRKEPTRDLMVRNAMTDLWMQELSDALPATNQSREDTEWL